MDASAYVTLTRQAGLLREMGQIANNLANMSSTGFRREGTVFSEFVQEVGGDVSSISMARAGASVFSGKQGVLTATGGTFDFAIEGDGYFLVNDGGEERLTRAGQFMPGSDGILVAADGAQLLDNGGAPVFVPPDATGVSLAADGTLSTAQGPLAQIGLWIPEEGASLERAEGVRFNVTGDLVPAEDTRVLQGHLEGSNVAPVIEVARMIAVQRAYELGQGFLDREDDRIRSFMRVFER